MHHSLPLHDGVAGCLSTYRAELAANIPPRGLHPIALASPVMRTCRFSGFEEERCVRYSNEAPAPSGPNLAIIGARAGLTR